MGMPPVRHIALSARQILGLALVTVFAMLLMAVAPQKSLAAPPVALSGAYDGAGNPSGINQFGTWRGAPASVALDYLGNDSWSDISNPSWLLDSWKPFTSAGGKLVLSVPMLVNSPQGSFADGAAGDYDSYFESLGQQLVADGDNNIVLRMGWEFNGNWFPWSLSSTNPAMSATEFVAYWRHLVDLFRAIPGANFKFDWTVNPGSSASNVPAADAYPGDAYVDYVGMDVYDASWGSDGGPISDPTARWNQIANQEYGMNWWLAFAQSHGKQVSVPEWGLVTDTTADPNGAGDDPSFIQDMYNWMKTNQPAYETYFNYSSYDELNTTNDPNASAEYQNLWGDSSGTTVAPTNTTTTTVSTPAPTDTTTTTVSTPAPTDTTTTTVSTPAPTNSTTTTVSTPAPTNSTTTTVSTPAPTNSTTTTISTPVPAADPAISTAAHSGSTTKAPVHTATPAVKPIKKASPAAKPSTKSHSLKTTRRVRREAGARQAKARQAAKAREAAKALRAEISAARSVGAQH